ncbi:MAG: oxygen-independent coproporphyrinogen III oxidase [Chlamydiia bacterium]|nr:oxygen-independent coproporphyrinogen III oxidase [Chlamydiia bacterium]
MMLYPSDLFQIDLAQLLRWNLPVPRYTSYPPAPQFYPVEEVLLRQKISLFDQTHKPLSLYVHIPFCKTMCLFCGCSVILNRSSDRQERYFAHLLREIERVAEQFTQKRGVSQLHLGGGTPTSLTAAQFERLMGHFHAYFAINADAEIAIEVDPRTVHEDGGIKLALLHSLGFNRISFGVQDLDPIVQEAVRRRQSEEMTVSTYWKARDLGFQSINIDLIYGLPLQTTTSFANTVDKLIALKPDRIALYSYAQVPWLKAHQKAIPEKTLPSTEEKLRIYVDARERFIQSGYVPIGMDHFSLHSDTLADAYGKGMLTRNFQGYSIQRADDMIGFGVTAIGFLEGAFFQNQKTLEAYGDLIDKGALPLYRGFVLTDEDVKRKFVIQNLMCRFQLDKREFFSRFAIDFDTHFAASQKTLDHLEQQGLIEQTAEKVIPTPLGRLFIRIVASAFDAYYHSGHGSAAV